MLTLGASSCVDLGELRLQSEEEKKTAWARARILYHDLVSSTPSFTHEYLMHTITTGLLTV